MDRDFGPFFLKFCSYFPYNAKLCINGNEYAKCQLRKRGIEFEALDNGVLSCADPKALQRICDGLDDKKIDRLLRKWLARLPIPLIGGTGWPTELRRIGFAANRRLLEIEQISHDCALGNDAFQHLQRPRQIQCQRAPALRLGDANAQAVLNAVLMFVFVARGFTNRDLRQQFAVLLGKRADEISPRRMSYELRRLRLHGLIERLPKTQRYRLTDEGLRTALFYTRVYARTLRPGMVPAVPAAPAGSSKAQRQFHAAEQAVNSCCDEAYIAA